MAGCSWIPGEKLFLRLHLGKFYSTAVLFFAVGALHVLLTGGASQRRHATAALCVSEACLGSEKSVVPTSISMVGPRSNRASAKATGDVDWSWSLVELSEARRIREFVDESADPCEDFYQFACGGWVNRTSIPGSHSSWDQFSILRDHLLLDVRELLEMEDTADELKPMTQARALYRTCLDTDKMERLGVSPLLHAIEMFHLPPRPPMMRGDGTAAGDKYDWLRVAARTSRMLGLGLLFKFSVGQDLRNSSRNVMMVDQGSCGISWEYLADRRRFRKELKAYQRYIEGMVAELEAARGGDALGRTPVSRTLARDVLGFALSLSKITRSREARRHEVPKFQEMTVQQLQDLTDIEEQDSENVPMNWTRYLREVFQDSGVPECARSDVILVAEPRYLQRLTFLVATSRAITIERYLWWGVLSSLAPYTLGKFRELTFRLTRELHGVLEDAPRWKTCSQIVNSNFGMAISRPYVQRYFHEKSKTEAVEMVEHVRNAFADHVWELSWMDDRTKSFAVDKAHAMKTLVGYPEWLASRERVLQHYSRTEIVKGEFFESILKLTETSVKASLREIRAVPNPDRWLIPATTVNAFYSPVMNSMTFPAGILQPPFFNLGLLSLNYGAIGSIMGHELTHGFDDQGRRFDKHGNMRQWWTRSTLLEYEERVRCFTEQYGSYSLPELGEDFFVNGVTTRGENIADNGGLRQALRALRNLQVYHGGDVHTALPGFAARFTSHQLFFLGFAHMWCGKSTLGALRSRLFEGAHSPNRYRVIGTLSNTVEFSEAWHCPRGSAMNPDKKCVLW